MAIDEQKRKSVSSPINIFGYFGALIGIISGIVFSTRLPGVSTYSFFSLIGAVCLLSVYIVSKKKDFFAVFSSRLSQDLSSLVVVSLALLMGVVWIEAVSSRYYTYFDFTRNERNTLSQETQQVLLNITKDVKIVAFYSTKDKRRKVLREYFERYRFYSKHISYEFFDPKLSTGKTEKYGITGNIIVIESGKKKKMLSNINEDRLTNAIMGVLKKSEQVIYFTNGHGESSIEDKMADGYYQPKQALLSEGFSVEQIYIHKRGIPKDTGLLIINGPKKEFTETELSEVQRYIDNGGKVLFLIDPYTQKKIGNLLKDYYIVLEDGVIIDKSTRLFGSDFEMAVGTQYSPNHQVTRNFSLLTTFPHSRPIYSQDQKIAQMIVLTGKISWVESDRKLLEEKSVAVFEKGQDKRGPVPLAVFSESQVNQWKVAVIGDSDFANNSYLNIRGNRDFFLNMVNTLSGEENLVLVRPKDMNFIPLVLSSSSVQIVFWFSVVIFPLLIVVTGLIFLGRQKRKATLVQKKFLFFLLLYAIVLSTSSRAAAASSLHEKPLRGKVIVSDFLLTPPLEGAQVTVVVDGDRFTTKSKKNGTYSLRFKPGRLKVKIEKEGYFPEKFEQLIDEETKYPPMQASYLYKIPPEKGVFLMGDEEYAKLNRVVIKKRDISQDTYEYIVDGNPMVLNNPVLKVVLYGPVTAMAKKMILIKISGSNRVALINREMDLMDYTYQELRIKNTKVENDFVIFAVKVEEPGRYLFVAIDGDDLSNEGYFIEAVD